MTPIRAGSLLLGLALFLVIGTEYIRYRHEQDLRQCLEFAAKMREGFPVGTNLATLCRKTVE